MPASTCAHFYLCRIVPGRVSTHLTSYFLLMSALHAADMYWNGAKSSLVGICIRAESESGQRSYPTWVTCANAVRCGLYSALPSNVGPSFRLDKIRGKLTKLLNLLIQSLVDRLHLNAEDITIQPVHPSIIGQDTWFQITYSSSGTTRYFSCQNAR